MTTKDSISRPISDVLPTDLFKVGEEVSYGLHGKCVIIGIEKKNINGEIASFYLVRSIKSPIIAKMQPPVKGEAAILVPTASASSSGLRKLMSKSAAETSLRLLGEPDYHFELRQPWVAKQKLLEDTIRKEGGIGLAKVIGHLYVLMSKDIVPPPTVNKLYENCFKIFSRELADAFGIPLKEIELLLQRTLKTKSAALDH